MHGRNKLTAKAKNSKQAWKKYWISIKKYRLMIFISIIFAIVVLVLIVGGTNACSADKWNNGICSDCKVRYELRGASNSLKYYSCPECGQEVARY